MRVGQTYTLSLETIQKLKDYSKKIEIPKSHIVEKAILELLEKEKEK